MPPKKSVFLFTVCFVRGITTKGHRTRSSDRQTDRQQSFCRNVRRPWCTSGRTAHRAWRRTQLRSSRLSSLLAFVYECPMKSTKEFEENRTIEKKHTKHANERTNERTNDRAKCLSAPLSLAIVVVIFVLSRTHNEQQPKLLKRVESNHHHLLAWFLLLFTFPSITHWSFLLVFTRRRRLDYFSSDNNAYITRCFFGFILLLSSSPSFHHHHV